MNAATPSEADVLKPISVATTPPRIPPPRVMNTFDAAIFSASHPAGLPARTSFRAIRRRMSAGVIHRATAPRPPTSGTSTRSRNGFCSSRSRRSVLPTAGTWACRTSPARRRRAMVLCAASTPRTTEKKTAMRPNGSSRLDIELHDLSRPEDAEGHQGGPRAEEDPPQPGGDQQVHVVGVDLEAVRGHHERQRDQDLHGQPSLGGEDLDLAADGVPLADGLGHDVEDLRQVAADLALDVDGQDGP